MLNECTPYENNTSATEAIAAPPWYTVTEQPGVDVSFARIGDPAPQPALSRGTFPHEAGVEPAHGPPIPPSSGTRLSPSAFCLKSCTTATLISPTTIKPNNSTSGWE